MNALNSQGNRQVASLETDLTRFEAGEGGPGMQGQITTTLAALSRLINDYESIARKEMVTAAREKAETRIVKLRDKHRELKARFDRAKNAGDLKSRNELLGVSSAMGAAGHTTETTMRRAPFNAASPSPMAESPYGSPYPGGAGTPTPREDYALREHSFIRETESNLDQYIAQGRAVLGDLVDQRSLLKGAKTRLLGAASTLGVSRETIAWVERRTTQDAWIFGAGATFTLFMFWVIWHYLG